MALSPAAQEVVNTVLDHIATPNGAFTDAEVAADCGAATEVATRWLRRYTGTNPFVLDVKRRSGILSVRQVRAILNCAIADNRAAITTSIAAATVATVATAPVGAPFIPAGRYTLVHADGTHTTFRFQLAEWAQHEPAGTLAVGYLYGPDNGTDFRNFGFVLPNGTVKVWHGDRSVGAPVANLRQFLTLDLDATEAAGMAYALRSGRCRKCGRTLTVPASIHAGMGPVCAAGGEDSD